MHQAKLLTLLMDKKYSSRRYKDAIMQCLNKCLWYNYVRYTKPLAAVCSNDAKSCYN